MKPSTNRTSPTKPLASGFRIKRHVSSQVSDQKILKSDTQILEKGSHHWLTANEDDWSITLADLLNQPTVCMQS
ncbi:hypothetical protein SLA2020_329180 [Shorea laevis]